MIWFGWDGFKKCQWLARSPSAGRTVYYPVREIMPVGASIICSGCWRGRVGGGRAGCQSASGTLHGLVIGGGWGGLVGDQLGTPVSS